MQTLGLLLKLPIMLWSNALEFCLLCSIYAPCVKYYALQIQHFSLLNLLKSQNLEYISLSNSSTVQHTINNSSTYVYKHFEFIFVAFATYLNAYFDKIITTDSPKSHNPVKNVHFPQTLSIVLEIADCFATLLCSKSCWHNRLKPSKHTGKRLKVILLITLKACTVYFHNISYWEV